MNLFEIEKDDLHAKFSDFFAFQAILGFGSFGVVVSAIAKSNNEECAVKVFSPYLAFVSTFSPDR